MKRFLPFLLLLLLGAFQAKALTAKHYAVTFSGSVITQVTTGTAGFTISSSKFSNATILNALVSTGSFGVSSASALDIVFDLSGHMDVINRSTLTVIYHLGLDGTNYKNVGGFATGPLSRIGIKASSSDFEVTLPGRPTYMCNAMQSFFLNGVTGQLTGLSIFLQGGIGAVGTPGDVFLQGTIRKGRKVYSF